MSHGPRVSLRIRGHSGGGGTKRRGPSLLPYHALMQSSPAAGLGRGWGGRRFAACLHARSMSTRRMDGRTGRMRQARRGMMNYKLIMGTQADVGDPIHCGALHQPSCLHASLPRRRRRRRLCHRRRVTDCRYSRPRTSAPINEYSKCARKSSHSSRSHHAG